MDAEQLHHDLISSEANIQLLNDHIDALQDELNYHRTDAKKASQQAYRLRIALSKAMNRLASLLDEDQFAEIEKIVEAAGVTPIDVIAKVGADKTAAYDPVKAFMDIPPIEGGL